MRNVLVYGGSGFIGKALVRELMRRGYCVYAVVPVGDTLPVEYDAARFECNLQDVRERLGGLLEGIEIDTCYCLAWNGLTAEGLSDYRTQIENVNYMLDLMAVLKQKGCKKFIGAGSISQFELFCEEGRKSLEEKHRYYRSALQSCEDMGNCLAKELDMEFVWPIITNVYGEGENSPRFINTLLRGLLSGREMPASEGNQLYDFVYLSDAVEAYIKIGEHGREFRKYIIGSGSPKTLKSFLEVVERVTGTEGKILYGQMKYQGVYFTEREYDTGQLQEDTGYEAHVSFEEGIRKLYLWLSGEVQDGDTANI